MPTTKTAKAAAAPARKSRQAAVKPTAGTGLPKPPKASKAAVNSAAKPGVKAAVQAALKAADPAPPKALKPKTLPKPAAPEKRAKSPKPPKKAPKVWALMVRDSFTMPEADFALIAALKARALAGQRETKKSELLRAGLHALAALDSPALLKALGELEPVKIGRPKKGQGHA